MLLLLLLFVLLLLLPLLLLLNIEIFYSLKKIEQWVLKIINNSLLKNFFILFFTLNHTVVHEGQKLSPIYTFWDCFFKRTFFFYKKNYNININFNIYRVCIFSSFFLIIIFFFNININILLHFRTLYVLSWTAEESFSEYITEYKFTYFILKIIYIFIYKYSI